MHKAESNQDQQEPSLLFNISSSESQGFAKSQLFSLVFQDIGDTYDIPREAAREITRLFESMLQYNLNSNNVPLGMCFSFPFTTHHRQFQNLPTSPYQRQ